MWKHTTKRSRTRLGDEPLNNDDGAFQTALPPAAGQIGGTMTAEQAAAEVLRTTNLGAPASQRSRQQSAPPGGVEEDDGGGPKKRFKRSPKKTDNSTLGAAQAGDDVLMDSIHYGASGMTPGTADHRQSAAVLGSSSMVDPHNQLPPTLTAVHSPPLPLPPSDWDQDRPARLSHPPWVDPSLQSTSAQSGTPSRHAPPPSDPKPSDHYYARFSTGNDRRSEPERHMEMLDDRHDTEPGITPNRSTKQAFGVIAGSNKWIKFITVVPGKHGRFKINAGMDLIYGGFSDVWRCDARLSDGKIINAAAKKFRAVRISRDADADAVTNKLLKRLTKELDIWMALEHPHIMPLLGFVLEGGPCIISPWCKNGNVADYIVRHPEVDRIQLVSEVASGLAYLHNRVPPVVHGDMKPDNVLINDTGHAVIMDFGLSAVMEDDPTLCTSLATASLRDAGNTRWMAPELLMEEGCTRSPSTDVYSFGCVALQIYTGEIPFKATPPIRIIYTLIQGRKPVVKRDDYPSLRPQSIDWLYNLMISCWDASPTSRPSMVTVESMLKTSSGKTPHPKRL
ncbi:hypothetical protein FS837_002864 [Tulasnella sp. UAMH 9824]|nr:hypothetical protein FS837_002864 [Tulasnella sp. UAMH 9824]